MTCFFFCPSPLLGTATISIYGNWCANLCYVCNTNLVDVQTMFASIYHLVLRKTPYVIFLPKVLRRKFIHGPTREFSTKSLFFLSPTQSRNKSNKNCSLMLVFIALTYEIALLYYSFYYDII